MVKRTARRVKRGRTVLDRSNRVFLVVVMLVATLSLGTIVGPWGKPFTRPKLSRLSESTLPAVSKPSKEYIYLGSRLIATEDPSAPTLAAPMSLVADGNSSSQVDIAWSAVAGADHYQIERSPNLSTDYLVLSSNVPTNSFSDTTVAAINAYLYRVRAVDALGNVSPYSSPDVATAITFTDDPVQISSTVIKAQHVWELRQAVNAVRDVAKLPRVLWTDNTTSAGALVGIKVKAIHIEELRSNLDEALRTLGLPITTYTDPAPPGLSGLAIKKIHIDQLRQRVK